MDKHVSNWDLDTGRVVGQCRRRAPDRGATVLWELCFKTPSSSIGGCPHRCRLGTRSERLLFVWCVTTHGGGEYFQTAPNPQTPLHYLTVQSNVHSPRPMLTSPILIFHISGGGQPSINTVLFDHGPFPFELGPENDLVTFLYFLGTLVRNFWIAILYMYWTI